jgi:hypothetical protein
MGQLVAHVRTIDKSQCLQERQPATSQAHVEPAAVGCKMNTLVRSMSALPDSQLSMDGVLSPPYQDRNI